MPMIPIAVPTFPAYNSRARSRAWRVNPRRVRLLRSQATARELAIAMRRAMRLSPKESRRVHGRVDTKNGEGRILLFIEQDDQGRCHWAVSPSVPGLQWRDPMGAVRGRRFDLRGAVVTFDTLLRSLSRRRLGLPSRIAKVGRHEALDALDGS